MEGMDILCGPKKSSISDSNLSFQTWNEQELLWVKDPDFSFSPVTPSHPSPCLSCSQRTSYPSSPLLPRSAFPALCTSHLLEFRATNEDSCRKTEVRNRYSLLKFYFACHPLPSSCANAKIIGFSNLTLMTICCL